MPLAPRAAVFALAIIVAGTAASCSTGGATGRAAGTTSGATAPRRAGEAATRAPAICGALTVRRTGVVRAPAATELSGLVLSRRQVGVLWTHNDSGDRPRVFALSSNGALRASFDVAGAQAVDWEDVAIGPGPRGTGDQLYLADIGDNAAVRPAVDVYRVAEPSVAGVTATPGITALATRLRLRYPDGAHDAETLLVDPRSGELVIVTKQLDGRSGVYAARRPAATSTTTMRRVATLELGLGGMATGGAVSADGTVIVVRTYTGIVAWSRRAGASLAGTLRRSPCVAPVSLGGEGQGEAIALNAGGTGFMTVPEGPRAVIRRYLPTRS